MSEPRKPDKSNRIVLIIMGVLALVTIGGTIYATMGEWNTPSAEPAAATQSDEEEALPSAGY